MIRRRSSLATRITLLGVLVALVTGLLAGGLAIGLIRHASATPAREALARLADAAARSAAEGTSGQARTARTLDALAVRFGSFGPSGAVRSTAPLARAALTPVQLREVRAGASVSERRVVAGVSVLVEARPTPDGGGVVLVQRYRDATAADGRALQRVLLAIVVSAAVAALVAALLARRIARPLRRTAAAAHALAAGDRAVRVPPEGPGEVADVAEAVNSLATALARSEGRQREFLLSVSHDLRTPLTAINGYAESLADGVLPAAGAPAAGAVIQAEAARLTRLVEDLLDLARLDAADFRVDAVDTDLATLVAETELAWRPRCAQAAVRLRAETVGSALPVRTDPVRLRQLLDGLLTNALRVTPPGAPVVIALRLEGGTALVEVRDGGPGLRDEDLPVAFERGELYRRYRGIRPVGTGLGLAIVARLADLLGGTVTAGHAPEGGARFTVRLPAGDGGSVRA